jgi:hypothetical protein
VTENLVELAGIEPATSSLRTTASAQIISFACLRLAAEYGPFRTGSPGVASNFMAHRT